MFVQKLRLQRGWSQQQLAELSGLSVRTVQRIERGHGASVESLKSLAAVFEVEFSSLQTEPSMNANIPAGASAEEALAFEHVRKLKAFYAHLIQYVLVVIGLAVLNLMTSPHYLWVQWVAMGWGTGLLGHAARVFNLIPFLGPQWEKRQVEKRLGRTL
jgi:transcriptional regulator with XRE-family HTH domain